jgi:hypothetical protein
MKAPDLTGQYVLGINIRLGNGKIVTKFDGRAITLKEATDIWNEVNSDDYQRFSVYQLTKVDIKKL